ncbi:hypothetical protein GGD63_003101 [Bradyrhizobium sp. cir1]|uniref:hypothetical protein n=1 Tax=Bradyrhizobium sp. cir1 TaxID=1445730 RepID=UPI001606479A|nr:hypothetical protein [Bradyrhizobium sp. cir1]MBB4370306.1 hypothetical protein [Bradyrhizobium sp. cir1]
MALEKAQEPASFRSAPMAAMRCASRGRVRTPWFRVVLTIIRLDFDRTPTMDGERPGRKTDRQDAGTVDAENSTGSIRPLRAFLSGIDFE